ncbi:MAG TPA: S26 family signal peptidase [Actinophytocola sp.]|uniref:S26 family signal peptidase n=1 Tax=Actinophytocola sp. TaxID=1872138 RepID=UPI002DB5B71B|nr:S26 family signal peptidase [Actinophytocola sp.]HEU5475339.1 S26 family signal peptidase [Actinophytocola sp.]
MKMLALLGFALAAVAAGRLAAHRWVAVTVRGDSMCPALTDGDRVLLRRTPVHRLAVGDIVVVRLPGMPRVVGPRDRPWLIKRVAALPGDPVPSAVAPAVDGAAHVPPNRLVLLSDNPVGAIDSRQFGYLTPDLVLGRVVRRLA